MNLVQLIIQLLTYASGILALFGTYLIIFYYNRYFLYDRVRAKGVQHFGKVTEFTESSDFINGFVFGGKAPVVEFINSNGHFRYVSTTYQSPSPYRIGQNVKIWVLSQKSGTEMALEDDVPREKLKRLLNVGITLCVISYPLIAMSVFRFYFA